MAALQCHLPERERVIINTSCERTLAGSGTGGWELLNTEAKSCPASAPLGIVESFGVYIMAGISLCHAGLL